YPNPYELSNPYDGVVSRILPPPPPKQRHAGLLVALVSLLCVVMILGGVIFGILLVNGQQQAKQAIQQQVKQVTQVTHPPTLAPTAAPVRPASASANDIYNDFTANGLGGTNLRDDKNWNCCTYIPEGGALVWTDSASGYALDIATFKSTSEAAIDAGQLDSQNFASNVVQTCLLSYDKTVPAGVVSRYVQVMERSCK
ncbi:MAG TPA: hypothetical protein VGT82_03010, partial [Ktedonobacteraceae bacterium]|nr:hypothetical protein [Ktedonobacteraceae bacterium]